MATEFVDATEVEATDEVAPPPPPPVEHKNGSAAASAKAQLKQRAQDKEDGDGASPAHARDSKPIRELKISEDASLKDIIDALSKEGGYRISVKRHEPTEFRDPNSGRVVTVGGHLKTYDQPVDEDLLQAKHGGGTFDLVFKRRGPTGSYVFVTQRRVNVAGDPRTDDVPRTMGPSQQPNQQPVAPVGEAPSVVNKAMDVLERQLEHTRQAQAPAPPDNTALIATFQMMINSLQETIKQRDQTLAAMQGQLTELGNRKPEVDPIKDKILTSMLDGESGRISGLRAAHESELRTVKANAVEDEKRLRDSFERDKAALVASFDRERVTMQHSHEIAMSSNKASFDTQIKVLEGQIRTLERDNTELRTEVKELRAKKDKGIVEMVKEMEVIKEALGTGDSESTMADKIADVVSNPDVLGFAGKIFGKAPPGAAGAAQPATGNPAQPAQPPAGGYKHQVVQTPDGQKWALQKDGSLVGPLKKKNKAAPSEPVLPVIEPEKISMAVNLLERAFVGGQDPTSVAQGSRALVPDEIIMAIRDHGTDVFMTKIAKLTAQSPLSNQEGRNWVRKLGKALVGE